MEVCTRYAYSGGPHLTLRILESWAVVILVLKMHLCFLVSDDMLERRVLVRIWLLHKGRGSWSNWSHNFNLLAIARSILHLSDRR